MYNITKVMDSFKESYLLDQNFLEDFLIPSLGLNNENLQEQPDELSHLFGGGMGLRIWQYPNQFSKYLIKLCEYAGNINSYLEIGCRHGGTFILTSEYLRVLNSNFKKATAVDLIDEPELISKYKKDSKLEISFLKYNSTSKEFQKHISNNFYDLIFIDGDHSYEGVKYDAENTRECCNIQVFHDTVNDACKGVGKYWSEFKKEFKKEYDFFDFKDQYESVNGSYLGIGVAVKKDWITI